MHAQSAAARWRQQGVSQVSPAQLRSISNSKRSSSRMKTKKKKKAAREGGEKRRELRAQSKQLLEQHLDGTRMEWQPDLCSPVAQAWADMRNTLERNERKQHQQNYYNLCIPFLLLFSVFCLFFSAVCVCVRVCLGRTIQSAACTRLACLSVLCLGKAQWGECWKNTI